MDGQQPLQINVDEVLRARLAKKYRYIPRFAVRWLERTIHQDEINAMLRHVGDRTGVEATDIALGDFGVKANVVGEDNIPSEGRYIFASNHPLGGLDGLILISLIGHRYEGRINFLVNDLLMALKPLHGIFLPVNKYGRQSREYAEQIEAAYAGDNQMITFPAGLCSRMGDDGTIRDLDWKAFVIREAVRTKRDIVPVLFDGENSRFFYRLARRRKKLGIKFNFEMLWLPDEMFKCKNRTFDVHFGAPISWQSLDAAHAASEAAKLRDVVYNLKKSRNQEAEKPSCG